MIIKGLTILLLVFISVLKVKAALTQEQKDTLLKLHRQARAAVNASNMKELNWDDDLANVAQVNIFKKKLNNRNNNKNLVISKIENIYIKYLNILY